MKSKKTKGGAGSASPASADSGCCAVKPPLGIIPERLWKECRAWDLIECLARHREQQSIPGEWFDELRRLLDELCIPNSPLHVMTPSGETSQ